MSYSSTGRNLREFPNPNQEEETPSNLRKIAACVMFIFHWIVLLSFSFFTWRLAIYLPFLLMYTEYDLGIRTGNILFSEDSSVLFSTYGLFYAPFVVSVIAMSISGVVIFKHFNISSLKQEWKNTLLISLSVSAFLVTIMAIKG